VLHTITQEVQSRVQADAATTEVCYCTRDFMFKVSQKEFVQYRRKDALPPVWHTLSTKFDTFWGDFQVFYDQNVSLPEPSLSSTVADDDSANADAEVLDAEDDELTDDQLQVSKARETLERMLAQKDADSARLEGLKAEHMNDAFMHVYPMFGSLNAGNVDQFNQAWEEESWKLVREIQEEEKGAQPLQSIEKIEKYRSLLQNFDALMADIASDNAQMATAT